MRIAIVGLGLIGGSLAKTIKTKTDFYIAGYDLSKSVVEKAIEENSIDCFTEDFSNFDLIIIALYPDDTISFLKKHIKSLSPDTIVIDCCGVKEIVCDSAEDIFKNSSAVFIGGHPMAGREFSGYDNSIDTLFNNASMILTPISSSPEAKISCAKDFFLSIGFRSVSITTPEHHDQIIAYTSQLAHVVSSAYMQSPTSDDFKGFSAGSFADLTRVAKLNPTMWTELFLSNKKALSQEITTLIESLNRFNEYIKNGDAGKLFEILKKGSDVKEKLTAER